MKGHKAKSPAHVEVKRHDYEITSQGCNSFSRVAHSCKVKLEELPGITLIDLKREIFPLVD